MTSLAETFASLKPHILHDAMPVGVEVFDAILNRLIHYQDTNPAIDLGLNDSLSRRLAWGSTAAEILSDCSSVCNRLLLSVPQAFPNPTESLLVVAIIADISCAASRHLARVAIERSSNERALVRRETMVYRQLAEALEQQQSLLGR